MKMNSDCRCELCLTQLALIGKPLVKWRAMAAYPYCEPIQSASLCTDKNSFQSGVTKYKSFASEDRLKPVFFDCFRTYEPVNRLNFII